MLISGANPSVLEQQGPISVGAIIGIDDFGQTSCIEFIRSVIVLTEWY